MVRYNRKDDVGLESSWRRLIQAHQDGEKLTTRPTHPVKMTLSDVNQGVDRKEVLTEMYGA